MKNQQPLAIQSETTEPGNQMYNMMGASNSSATVQYDGMDPSPNLSQNENGVQPVKPGVMRGKLYYGWTKSRWILLVTNSLFMAYALIVLFGCLATYGQTYLDAEVIVAADRTMLDVAFACAVISTFTASVGMAGIIRKSRRLLGIYSLLLWPCFALLCAVGYLGYKHDTWNLKAKLGMQWRYSLNDNGRITIQNNLHCCGFENPSDHATYFAKCFPRSLLPGCAHKFTMFQSTFLKKAYTTAFILVPLQLGVMIVGILCSNHITLQFGRRPRPHIAYLEGYDDWRSWEKAQTKEKDDPQEYDAKGYPLQFSPIDLFSNPNNDMQPPQSTTTAFGGPNFTTGDATRKRSVHRQVQR